MQNVPSYVIQFTLDSEERLAHSSNPEFCNFSKEEVGFIRWKQYFMERESIIT